MKVSLFSAALAAALVSLTLATASAQSSFNIGPTPPPPPPPGGGGASGCVSTVLAGNTSMYICPTYYNAQLGGTQCQGGVNFVGGGYNLAQGPCNTGQSFLGGRLTCGGGGGGGGPQAFNIGPGGGGGNNSCHWQPSPAGAAQGYHPENVYVNYH
jgi:hypothetical protein